MHFFVFVFVFVFIFCFVFSFFLFFFFFLHYFILHNAKPTLFNLGMKERRLGLAENAGELLLSQVLRNLKKLQFRYVFRLVKIPSRIKLTKESEIKIIVKSARLQPLSFSIVTGSTANKRDQTTLPNYRCHETSFELEILVKS